MKGSKSSGSETLALEEQEQEGVPPDAGGDAAPRRMARDPTSHSPHLPPQVAKQLHDSVDSQSFDDERRQLAQVACEG